MNRCQTLRRTQHLARMSLMFGWVMVALLVTTGCQLSAPLAQQVTLSPATNYAGTATPKASAAEPANGNTNVVRGQNGYLPAPTPTNTGTLPAPAYIPTVPPAPVPGSAPQVPSATYPNAVPYTPSGIAPYNAPAASQPYVAQPGLPAQNGMPPGTVGSSVPSIEVMPNMAGNMYQSTLNQPEEPWGPPIREVPVDVWVNEARTGRFMVGGAVNSDAGVTGQIVLDERNFDITRPPRSFAEVLSGRAFRGAGQTFRLEAVPGNNFQRHSISFGDPYLFGYLPLSFNINGFYFDRRYQDYDENRVGGRTSLGYRLTPDLTLEFGVRGETVKFENPRILGIPEVDRLVGDHDLYGGNVRLTHDTRDIPFAPTEGHLMQLEYEQIFGSFDYPRFNAKLQQFVLMRQRPDGSGRHTLSFSYDLGISGSQTPIFENYFAGGYSTLRGFSFRGASPTVNTFQVGGRLRFLGSAEYQFPITADDMFKGVVFLDYGTVERDLEINAENIRVAPGFGFRIAIPAMGPAPLAFDFGFPIAYNNTDDRQVFSFFVGFNR